MIKVLSITLSIIFLGSAEFALADRYSDCDQLEEPNRTIRGCTQIMKSRKKESREERITAYINRGVAYGDKGQHDRAIKDYDRAILLNQKLAEAYGKKSQFDWTIADYTKAIELNLNDDLAYRGRGLSYITLNITGRAIVDFNNAIKLNPNDPENYFGRALAFNLKGQKEKAIADFRKALEIDPSHEEARAELKKLGKEP